LLLLFLKRDPRLVLAGAVTAIGALGRGVECLPGDAGVHLFHISAIIEKMGRLSIGIGVRSANLDWELGLRGSAFAGGRCRILGKASMLCCQ